MQRYHNFTPDEIAAGLRRNGFDVRGPDSQGKYETTTAICHADGKQPYKLGFGPDRKGDGIVAGCWSESCGTGTDSQRETLRKLRRAAGLSEGKSSRSPSKAAFTGAAPPWQHVATYASTRDDRPDKGVYRQDWPAGGCDSWRGCKDKAAHKHIRQDAGPMDGYELLAWREPVGDTLVLAEGEKAAAALVSAQGYTPACWIGGAQNVGKADFSLAAGRTIYLWADNDAQGIKAMETAARKCLEAGAGELRMIPADRLPAGKGADAADVSERERLELLGAAVAYAPPASPAADGERGEIRSRFAPGELPEITDADSLHEVNMSPLADAMRLLNYCPERLLLAEDKVNMVTEVYLLNDVGIWERNNEQLRPLMAAATRAWHKQHVDDGPASMLQQSAKWISRIQGARGSDETLRMMQAAYNTLKGKGELPEGLRWAEVEQLDADTRFLGTKSGVLDLFTGEILPHAQGAEKLITRSIPDAFDIDADIGNADAQQLLAHLPDGERQYLLEATAFALRGLVARRFYMLNGPPASGKTTFLGAVGAALGEVKNGGYHAALGIDSLMENRFSNRNAHTEGINDIGAARIASKSEMPKSGRLDVALIKLLSGGGTTQVRGIHQAARTVRLKATIIIAVNPEDARRVWVTDSGFAERTKILPYSPIDTGPRGAEYQTRMQDDAAARMGVMAMLVKAGIGKDAPPDDIASVQEAMERQERDSQDDVGLWLMDSLLVTGNKGDVIPCSELWDKAAEYFDTPKDAKEILGYNKKSIVGLARHVVPAFPTSRIVSVNGKKVRAHVGIRWLEQELSELRGENPAQGELGQLPEMLPDGDFIRQCVGCKDAFAESKMHWREQRAYCVRCFAGELGE